MILLETHIYKKKQLKTFQCILIFYDKHGDVVISFGIVMLTFYFNFECLIKTVEIEYNE